MDLELAKKFYKEMLLIRRFEEKSAELYMEQKIRGFLHLYIGEEANAVGAINAIRDDDNVVATYREHAHAIMKGISPNRVMAELFGKLDGTSRGRGGSMHIFDREKRFFGGYAIVAEGMPIADGIAMADKRQNNDRVTLCFFGDGAVDEGEFHEALNLAALWELPVLFYCENNQYSMGMPLKYAESNSDIAKKASSYNIESYKIDGMDVFEVYEKVKESVKKIRETKKPIFIESVTYRFKAHSMYDPELYRSKEEVEEWKKKDPLIKLKEALKKENLLEKLNEKDIEKEVENIVNEAVDFAEKSPLEPIEDLEKFVYAKDIK